MRHSSSRAFLALLVLLFLGHAAVAVSSPDDFFAPKWTPEQEVRAHQLAETLSHSKSTSKRVSAVEELTKVGAAARYAVPELIMALADKNTKVKAAAKELLYDRKKFATVLLPGLIYAKGNENKYVRDLVNTLNDPDVIDSRAYTEALKDADPLVRREIASIIYRLAETNSKSGNEINMIYLRTMARDWAEAALHDSAISLNLVLALSDIKAEQELTYLANIAPNSPDSRNLSSEAGAMLYQLYDKELSDADAQKRLNGVTKFGEVPAITDSTLKKLVGLLQDPDAAVRSASAVTLTKFGAKAVSVIANALNTAAKDPGPGAVVLRRIGGPAVAPLSRMLEDVDSSTRLKAAFALGLLGMEGKEAVPLLTRVMKEDVSAEVRVAAGKALAQIGTNAPPMEIEQTTTISAYSLGDEKDARLMTVTKQGKWSCAFSFGPLPADVAVPDVVVALYNKGQEQIDKREGPTKNFLDLKPGTYFFRIYLKDGKKSDQPVAVKIDLIDE